MGRRVIVYVVLLGVLVATGQVWLLSALLSRSGPGGRSGWDSIKAATRPKQQRSANMPLLTVGTPYSARGCATILPGERYKIDLTASGGSTDDGMLCNYGISAAFPPASIYTGISANATEPYWPRDAYFDDIAPSSTITLYIRVFGDDASEVVEDHSVELAVDTTTKPSFPSFLQDVDDCDPLTFTARITVDRADSWSYRLLDNHGLEVSGGTPNSPDTSGCSFQVVVTGITGASQIEITATNANGSTTQAFNLVVPDVPTASISANPTSVTSGNSATLTWSTSDASTVTIDNGVGAVAPSGSTTVEPSETTTYTITAEGACETVTASVTVTVQGVPVPGMASMTWEAQEGLGSRKIAHLMTPAVLNWVTIDPSRVPRTVRVSARAASLEDVRTSVTSRVSARSEVRGNRTARVSARATIRKTLEVRVSARARSLYPDRYHVKARNVATGVVSEWGVIDADTSPLTLTDVSIASGTYSVWIEREGVFWKDARVGSEFTVLITDGQPPVVMDLPMAENLAASISGGVTLLSWDASSDITDDGLSWGLWFGATSPVTITGEPTYRFLASIGQTGYEYLISQETSEYVSVAAIGSDGTRGVAAELYLPWSTSAPTSPHNQVATC